MPQIDPLTIALSGLANANRSIAVVAQNIANASTPGYVHETQQQRAAGAGGLPMGVTSGIAIRDLDVALQARLITQAASASETQVRSETLARIDAVQGTPGTGGDLASLVGKLGDAFSALLNDPASAPQQRAVVDQATALAGHLRQTATTIGDLRQSAHDRVVSDVGALNAALTRIGGLSRQIIQVRASGGSTADLENQRDAAVMDASGFLDLRAVARPNGDMTVLTASGLELPTHGTPPLTVTPASVGAVSFYPGGGIAAVTLNGIDVTTAMSSGSIGAAINLRDTILPTSQGVLDEFAQTLAGRFDAQGLALFSDPAGAVPAPAAAGPRQAPYVGFAGTIVVNPAVMALPSLVRDGTHNVVGTPTGPQGFAVNPAGGPSGSTTLITRVLNYALTAQVAPGNPQSAPSLIGMGPTGTATSSIVAPSALGAFAAAVVARQAGDAAVADSAATASRDTQVALQRSLSERSGVDMDAELSHMIALQNAYSANARVITTMQSLWSQLMQIIR